MATRAASTGRRFDSLEQEAFLGLWRTYDRLRALEDELFARHDLTPQQYNALRLDKLQQRGLVARDRPADNRRVVRVGITPAGIALLDELRQPLRDCHARQLGHLPRKDLEALVALLHAARLPHEDPDSPWR
jgi:hypothetical protein